jgi:hypothetical protein
MSEFRHRGADKTAPPACRMRLAKNGWRCGAVIAALAGLALGLGTASAPAQRPADTPPPTEEALQLLAQARQAYQGVRDYTCLFIKKEQVQGRVQPENVIAMKVRCQPFSVYLRWLSPSNAAGQEACYVAGRNGGQMRVRSHGLLGVVGFVSMDLRDPRAMQYNRHTLAEAGIGNLMDRLSQFWEAARRSNALQFHLGEFEYNHRRCTRVEAAYVQRTSGPSYSYRSAVYFDKQHHLPIRIEAYDWPRPGGPPQGDLLESYSYADLRFNVGLGDEAFNF